MPRLELGRLEGMVAERRNSIYQPGARSKYWLKVKRLSIKDFVVGGYKLGSGPCPAPSAHSCWGIYEGGQLRDAGSVGSGFDKAMLEALMEPLHLLETDECPFVHDRELGKMEARWVTPKIVVTVKFRVGR